MVYISVARGGYSASSSSPPQFCTLLIPLILAKTTSCSYSLILSVILTILANQELPDRSDYEYK